LSSKWRAENDFAAESHNFCVGICDLNCGTEITNADSKSVILGKGIITFYMSVWCIFVFCKLSFSSAILIMTEYQQTSVGEFKPNLIALRKSILLLI